MIKSVACDLCDHEAQGETFDAWMQALRPHYEEVHAAFMQSRADLSPDEQKAEMQTWMDENRERFEKA